jgi:hypothetical protein
MLTHLVQYHLYDYEHVACVWQMTVLDGSVYYGVINLAMSWRAHASFYILKNNGRFFFSVGSRRLFIEKKV